MITALGRQSRRRIHLQRHLPHVMDRFSGHIVHSSRCRPALARIQPQSREVAGLNGRETKSADNCGRREGAISYWELVQCNKTGWGWQHFFVCYGI
jgi:hypothetical protein